MNNMKLITLDYLVKVVFLELWNILDEKHQVYLIESFTALGRIYMKKPFTMRDAVTVPNTLVTDVIFDEDFRKELSAQTTLQNGG